ncbi:MAG TPA: HAD-IA family hydrolase [Phycisphaerales bacterium]|nr:HAD-IA family hydrolase [Phycisphaerales bacterium]
MQSPDIRLKNSPNIQLVCFDLGGVLLRICRTFDEAARRAGVAVHPDTPNEAADIQARAEISEAYQRGRITTDDFALLIRKGFGNVYTVEELLRIHDAWIIEEYPAIASLIDAIHDAGVRTAALSNTNERHFNLFSQFPSLSKLQAIHASHHLGLHKPEMEIYRELERRTGATPEGILFFDDLPENVAAAREAGWRAVQIDHTGNPAKQMSEALKEHGVSEAAKAALA